MRTLLLLLRSQLPILLSLAALVVGCAFALVEPPVVRTLRNAVFDSYQRWRPRPYEASPVRMVDIDDDSLARLGQWPWPRTQMALLIERLRTLGASSIAMDILFAEVDRTNPAKVLAPYAGEPDVEALLGRLPDHDSAFAEAIRGGNVITSFVLTNAVESTAPPQVKAPFVTAGDDPLLFLPTYRSGVGSLEPFQSAAAGNGAMNVAVSGDGVVRRVQILLASAGKIYPTLTAEALRVGVGGTNYVVKSSGASGESRFGGKTGIVAVRIGDRAVTTDPRGGVLLHYTEPRPERHIPAWKLFEEDVSLPEGAIVFVGTTAAGLKDLRLDPLGNTIAGADVHAQAVEQILTDTYLTRPDWAPALELLLMLATWILLVVLILRLGAVWSALFGVATVAAICSVSWMAFLQARLLLDPVVPALTSVAIYFACSVPRHLEAERQRRWIRNAFSSYISPNLVDFLIENPDQFELGGERRECSFVMTDLANFTPLVEQGEPAVILETLSEYIDGMSQVVLAHEGTLDRIVGDAFSVTFSAPVRQEDHAERAVACALAMDRYSETFRAAKAEEGLSFGITRIGVNTGTVTIGNVGGETFFDYRPLGDAINTASRLEAVNRQLGTRVCVSGHTIEQCTGFVGRPVGHLLLKGKSRSIPAYEPLTEEEAASDRVRDYLEGYELLRQEDPAARDVFASLSERYPDDALIRLRLERLDSGERGELLTFAEK